MMRGVGASDSRPEEEGWIESMSLAQTKDRGERRAEESKFPLTKRIEGSYVLIQACSFGDCIRATARS